MSHASTLPDREEPASQPLRSARGIRLSGFVRRALEHETARGVGLSLLLTVLSAAASFGMFAVLARAMAPAEFGRFAIWFNVVSFLAVVAVFGQEMMIARSWNEHHQGGSHGLARGALRFGAFAAGVGAALAAAAFLIIGWTVGLEPALTAGLCVFLVAQTYSLYTSQAARIIAGLASGTVHREITWRVLVVATAIGCLGIGQPFTIEAFFAVAATGVVMAVALQTRSIWRALPPEVRLSAVQSDAPAWRKRSAKVWSSAILESSSQYLDVVLIGMILSPIEAGAYFVASKLANVFAVLGDGISLYATRKIPSLFYGGQRNRLQQVLSQLAAVTSGLALVGLFDVILEGHMLLALFGAGYKDYADVLIILCAGTAITAMAGPAPTVLLVAGQEGRYVVVLAAGLMLRYGAIATLAWSSSLHGAALGNAAGMVVTALLFNVLCRRALRLDPSLLGTLRAATVRFRPPRTVPTAS